MSEEKDSIVENIERLGRLTQINLSYNDYVTHAFVLGLWYQDLPECALGFIEKAHGWNYQKLIPAQLSQSYDSLYPHLCAAQFVSQTGDAWHSIYQDFRRKGFRRLAVHRDGGRLQYLMFKHSISKPQGYRDLHVVLDISIATCKQIQIGTETKEIPVMKTVCEDLVEIQDTLDESVPGPHSPDALVNEGPRHIQMSGICMPGCPKCAAEAEYEMEHGPEGQIPRKSDFSDELPF